MADADGFQLSQLLRQGDAEGIGLSPAKIISGFVQTEFTAGSQGAVQGDIDLRIRSGAAQITGGDGNNVYDRLFSVRDRIQGPVDFTVILALGQPAVIRVISTDITSYRTLESFPQTVLMIPVMEHMWLESLRQKTIMEWVSRQLQAA